MSADTNARFGRLLKTIAVLRVLVPVWAAVGLLVFFITQRDAGAWARIDAVGRAVVIVLLIEVVLGAASVLLKMESSLFRINDTLMDLRDSAERQARSLEAVADQSRLSDLARSIASREQERDLIRRAANEALIGGDLESVYYYADQLEQRHGYKQEASRLRSEVEAHRRDVEERFVEDAVGRVEGLLAGGEWERARSEIDRLTKLHPSVERIQQLPDQFVDRRSDHKRRLLKQWDEAVQRNDIDKGIAILRELDGFLSPNEAAALEESARGVFRAKLHNLGVQFSIAVTDRNWAAALHVGEQIIHEFPNSRMAAEVREHLEALRSRAARSTAVES
ncbi:MAG: hypothetical protein U1A27_02845 [Phycisphaerae bacterium]